jgi:hypothetical protein
MATISGVERHSKRLKSAQQVGRQVVAALYSAGQNIEIDAELSITAGSISGAGHVPSLPGQPPNADTRDLDSKIETTVVAQNPPTVHVTAYSDHAVDMEFGNSKIAERPYLRPATAKNRKQVGKDVADAVRVTIRRG